MQSYKKYWIIGILIPVVLAVFLLLIIREHDTSGTSSKPIHQPKPIQERPVQLSSLHTHTKNPSKMSIDSDGKKKQISDNRSSHSETEKEQDGVEKDLGEEEIAKLLAEYLSQYESNEEIPSPGELAKSIDPDKDFVWFEGPDGVRRYLRPGETVVDEGWGVGTWNPRPRTEEEKRRFTEIVQQINDLRKQMSVDNPETMAIIKRIMELNAELDIIKAETSLPSYRRIKISAYRRDPKTGEIIK